MNVWLIIANPYAYDQALQKAIAQAQLLQTELRVVYFIAVGSVDTMIHELSEMGWFGGASLRNLQTSMSKGYRGLANDVIKRVQRKAEPLKVVVEGIVEEPSLKFYLEEILTVGAAKIIVAGSRELSSKLGDLPAAVEYIEEE